MDPDVVYLTKDFEPVSKDDPRMVMVKVRQPDGKIVFGSPVKAKQNQKLFIQTFEGHEGRPGLVGGSLPKDQQADKQTGGKSMVVHHGTSIQNVASIKQSGILKKKAPIGSRPASVYFMNDFNQTRDYVQDLHLEEGKGYAIITFNIPNGVKVIEDEEEGGSYRIEESVPPGWIQSIAYYNSKNERIG